jgi:allantoicase
MAVGCNNNDVVKGSGGEEDWTTILPIMPLMPGHEGTHHHLFKVSKEATLRMIVIGGVTHLRLSNFPDGEVARIRA